MGRTLGVVAVSVAVGLALLIGIVAYTTHHQGQGGAGGGGAQSIVPVGPRGQTTRPLANVNGINPGSGGGSVNPAPAARSGPAGVSGAGGSANGIQVTVGGGAGGQQAAPAATQSCTPNLLQSLVGVVGSLLGGGGPTC